MSWVRLGFIFFSIVSFQLEIPIGQKLIFSLKAVTTVVGEVALEHPPPTEQLRAAMAMH